MPMATHPSSAHLAACADACMSCFAVCTRTFSQHCLHHGGDHLEHRHARLMLDCAEICRTSATFLLRGSEFHQTTCRACAEVCAACATSCAQFTELEMQACAAECRKCADSCQSMATAGRSREPT